MTALFSGSYLVADVQFLLQPMTLASTDIADKEQLIQSGQKHYSQMISAEPVPSPQHMAIYRQALQQHGLRMARDIQALALALQPLAVNGEITLASFVRAGLPVAVLLARALRELGVACRHYGISIIRDKGIDQQALAFITRQHDPASLFFVDGWTGKGAIAAELARCLADDRRFVDQPRLVTLADPCGKSWLSASAQDWLIPSGVLGATVSGLVSRSILTDNGYHGCVNCRHLAEHDVTQSFIEHLDSLRVGLDTVQASTPWTTAQKQHLQRQSLQVINGFAARCDVDNPNHIKPGIAEATRAVMRRVPERIFVRDRRDADVQLLLTLAAERGVKIEEAEDDLANYRALTIIRRLTR